jgi:hypothetical protein
MAAHATSRESGPRPRRTPLKATSPIHHIRQKVVVAKTGYVIYTTMEDIPEGELVLAGTLFSK